MQCHVVGCATDRNASFVVLRQRHNCMVKAQVEGFKCVRRRRGRPGDAKATGDSKDQLGIIHAYKCQMALIAVYGTLLLEERR